MWLAQGHTENLYWSKTKDVRLQRAVPHSKGSLSHSDKALQLAIEPSDYVIHTKNTRHFHQLLTSLLSFFPAGQHNYVYAKMCMQRHNKTSTTRMVNLHSWSTSSLLFSPKIEIRRGKKSPQALKLGRNGRKSYLESQGTLSICKLFMLPYTAQLPSCLIPVTKTSTRNTIFSLQSQIPYISIFQNAV